MYVPDKPFAPDHEPHWGPNGKAVYERTYQRTKANGERETWAETVDRVVRGNLSLVDEKHIEPGEYEALCNLIYDFKILPAGRHLWASGVKGRQYLFNCHVSGWGEKFSDHFRFTFLRLMEGGGVGANYSTRFLRPYGAPRRTLNVHIVCDPSHPDYAAMKDAGLLSEEYCSDWEGAYPIEDSREGWSDALTDLLDTYMSDTAPEHQNRVYDVTNVRAKGSRLKTFGGYASGPQPLAEMMDTVSIVMNTRVMTGFNHITPLDAMEIDHAIAECVVSGGNRRSARMSIVEWDDPYVSHFIGCKSSTDKHWTTNISVAVDEHFFAALGHWDVIKGSGIMIPSPEDMAAKKAYYVHKAVTEGMLKNGEPGYWNRALSQRGEVGEVISTNPCGEIALEAWENCNLGHVNMSAFADLSYGALLDAHRLMARFLIRATYGDVNAPEQREALDRNRRIGVGHFGVQGYLVKQGYLYSEASNYTWFQKQLQSLQDRVRAAANDYAFELRIPAPVKVTTVAPTGSIAKLSGDPEGIHPIYARYYNQRIRFSTTDLSQLIQLSRYRAMGYAIEKDQSAANTEIAVIPTKVSLVDDVIDRGYPEENVESADEISLVDMLAFQETYQRFYADNAVSFTVNFPEGELDHGELMETLRDFLPHLKGTTLMPDGTRPQAPLTRISREQYEASQVKGEGDGYDEECANGACPIR